ncbi:MAG: bile acid:sodium symporter [Leptospiraceae bacterium]|nr:bile acid:sodium symporter [Leptospiraceae bacterium]
MMEACNIPADYQMINPLQEALLGIMILVIMFGMGSGLTLQNFKYFTKDPKGVLIGFASQFGVMPLVALGLAIWLELDPILAIALILVGSLPAGTTSNMFAYFSRGDVALSITMTTFSTIAAVVMTPLILDSYGAGFASQINLPGDGEFSIPTNKIIVSLVAVLLPVALGMLLRRYSPGWAKAAEDTASFMGIIVILFLVGTFLGDGYKRCLMAKTDWATYVAAIGVGMGGMLFGYLLSMLLRLDKRHRRTVSLETGIQNGPLAVGIVTFSFHESAQLLAGMLWLPILYSFFIVISSSFVTMFYRKIGKLDFEIYENGEVQKRLFGEQWVPLKE